MPYRVSLISRSGQFKAVCTPRDVGIDVLITRRAGHISSKSDPSFPDRPTQFMWAQAGRYLVRNRSWHVVVDEVYRVMRTI